MSVYLSFYDAQSGLRLRKIKADMAVPEVGDEVVLFADVGDSPKVYIVKSRRFVYGVTRMYSVAITLEILTSQNLFNSPQLTDEVLRAQAACYPQPVEWPAFVLPYDLEAGIASAEWYRFYMSLAEEGYAKAEDIRHEADQPLCRVVITPAGREHYLKLNAALQAMKTPN